ncbi:hypothetical protein [Mucilaginibacter flavus]|uniref:hypothetical protein n=1 Tax=Mucilaginibacter flavus TaxID=931504 RepID=UPI0025B5F723|nr:hypothetical protein [Mucilaginibacter flavus]MDN3580415.1 hypothetical protein [Mucilaginibacter flavus]
MKPTISKSTACIIMAAAYILWLLIINLVKISKWSVNFYLNSTLSTLFSLIHCLLFFYLVCILKSKHEKKSITISFLIFVLLGMLSIPLNFPVFQIQSIMLTIGALAAIAVLNMAFQSFRVTDYTTATGFKLLGLTMTFKVAAQIGLPFIWGYLADNFSIAYAYLSFIPPILEFFVTLAVIFIFFEAYKEQKEQYYQLQHTEASRTFIPNPLDLQE